MSNILIDTNIFGNGNQYENYVKYGQNSQKATYFQKF